MAHNLLNEIEIGSKNGLLKKRIITHYMHNGSSTIPDLARELNLSVPTVTKFINEMCDDGYINDYGKLETVSGRHPSLYGLNPAGATHGESLAGYRQRSCPLHEWPVAVRGNCCNRCKRHKRCKQCKRWQLPPPESQVIVLSVSFMVAHASYGADY